jgi:glycosyltransferase involved in cell wall biosynthesis
MMASASGPDELILLSPLRAHRGPRGGLVLTRKYMAGAAQYARHWPGSVTSLVRASETATTDMDHQEYLPGDAGTGLELRPEEEAALAARLAPAAVVLAFLERGEARTLVLCERIGVPVVFVAEYSPRTERQILASEVANPLLRLRRLVWLYRTERIRRSMLARAAGLQCSGTPTYEVYRKLCRDTLLFFDNRVRRDDVIAETELAAKARALGEGQPLRLVFGGRLIAMKGVMELPAVAERLARAGVRFTLDIFGSGPLAAALQARIDALGLSDRVALRGVLDFEAGWIPHLRKNADLFVCCHPQGDPSSTYPEVMSCGVPIAGYANDAFRGIADASGAGWVVPVFDAAALARQIAELDRDRSAIAEAGRRARDFAARHAFEETFAARAAHLVRNSRLPGTLRRDTGVA